MGFKITNYDKIKNMTVEEFVKHRLRMCPDGRKIGGKNCLWKPKNPNTDFCHDCWIEYYNQEAENGQPHENDH